LTNKEKYKAFIRNQYVPVFYQDWYLDATCDSPWDVAIVEDDGDIVGILVYMIKRKFGLTYILHPQMCPYMGPLFFGMQETDKVYKELIESLPKHHLMIQEYFHSIPKLSSNLTTSNKYTYTISSDESIDILRSKLSSDRRRRIRKAGEHFVYEETDSIQEFQAFLEHSFAHRNRSNPYGGIEMQRLDAALADHGARKIVKATDPEGKVVAMQYFMQDQKWVYNLANGVITDYRHYALSYILWNEIERAHDQRKSFDFEGSMIPGVETFFKSMGGTKTHYQSIYQSANPLIDLLVNIKKKL